MKVLLQGLILNHTEPNIKEKNDILLIDGIINKIGDITEDDKKSAQVFDFTDKICSPGFFDMHVHLREPGREDEETVLTGCNASANGGFTGIACMPNTDPTLDTADTIISIKQKSQNHLVDVFPIGAATLGRKGEALAPITELVEAGAVGFSDDGTAIKNAAVLRKVMEYSSMYNSVVIEHCEDESLADGTMNEGTMSTKLGLPPIPTVAEDIIVARDILMAEYLNTKIHIAHISSKKSIELVRIAKAGGVKVTAEVTPHHFSLNDESLNSYDTNYKMNPPLRSEEDRLAVLEGLIDGTIDCIASDHAPHSIEEKEMEFIYAPNGIIGLETQIGLAFTELVHKNILTVEELINKFAVNPRKILNIPIPKFELGEVANFTIIDPNEVWTVNVNNSKSKSRNSPFDKKLLTGKAIAAINNAQMYYENNTVNL